MRVDFSTEPIKTVLHVGCGVANPAKLHQMFQGGGWTELRLDIDPDVQPDIISSITDMKPVADASVDGVWSSHNLEHLYSHEVPVALAEFQRVLRPGGVVLVTMPDLQSVATAIANDQLEDTLYVSPAGPICPVDVLYGFRKAITAGNVYMAHKTGFTAKTLGQKLEAAGFTQVRVERGGAFDLWGIGYKPA
jgi:ubiquinone/menaquinone biosynthesis C-methylase UbiE